MAKKEPYDWIDDPFNPEKERQEQEQMRTSSGCAWGAVALLVVAIVLVIAAFNVISMLMSATPL
ncbi:MAG: hypothetical protein Q4E12_05780 [Coriobacteriia bacterium]|nr:hypothetical protein [Coriobacteriia bacterium]